MTTSTPPFIYHGGRLVSAQTPLFSSHHPAWRLGDGIFETLLVVGGNLFNGAAHQVRLTNGLAFYDLHGVDLDQTFTLAQDLIQKNGLGDGYLRILITRGGRDAPSLGYGVPEEDTLPAVVTLQTIPGVFPPPLKEISLWPSAFVLANPAPCKTLSSLVYAQALRDARAHHATNALLCDPHGLVCEAASGNLFWIRGETLYTPSLDLPLIPGCMREIVWDLWPGPKEAGHYRTNDLLAAEAVFMTSVGVLIAPIVRILGPRPRVWPQDDRVLGLRNQMIEKIRCL
jgi:branched-chain amino acid aminotransferase